MGVALLPDVSDLRSVQFTHRELVRTEKKKKVILADVREELQTSLLLKGFCQYTSAARCPTTNLPAFSLQTCPLCFFLVPDDFLHLSLDLEWEILVSRKCYMGGPGASATWCGVSPAGTLNVRLSPGCRGFSTATAFWKVKKKRNTTTGPLCC